ncbi:MAG: F0F1 ATP synthase subunit gamma [Prochloraceae cyanobacterium]|nr:F0F1 ATP synthase subunit gamma [Prochloraceae cyanobacterium]
MTTTESLKRKINSIQDLYTVVKTMKALAAVSIRQYEKALESLTDYNRTVEMGLQIVLRQQYFSGKVSFPLSASGEKARSQSRLGAIIFGSDRGLCGQFNEQIASHGLAYLKQSTKPVIAVVGSRVVYSIEAAGYAIDAQFSLANSAVGITEKVQQVLLKIEQWEQQQIERIVLLYNQTTSNASYRPVSFQLLPLDLNWLSSLQRKQWSSSTIPTFTMDENQLFSALIRQYIFVSLYRAFAFSLASENASRLASMQSAQKNIEERLGDLNAQYRRDRQTSITAELLDVVGGFEALS